MREPVDPYVPPRIRSAELIRPADRRREFTTREAERRLHQKEKTRWAPIAYGVFLVAVLAISCIAYTTYAFSRFRGEILPGVHVDQVALSGLGDPQAQFVMNQAVNSIYKEPVRLVYRAFSVTPRAADIGYGPKVKETVKAAEQVGRTESFIEQLLDRLPLHPDHSISLVYTVDDGKLRQYIQRIAKSAALNIAPQDAQLSVDKKNGNHVVLVQSQPGRTLDVSRTISAVHAALGALTTQTVELPVNGTAPVISDAYAQGIRDRVENFLSNPPVIALGKRVVQTTRADLVPALSFSKRVTKQHADIVMTVQSNAVQSYVSQLAGTIDRQAQVARLDYSGGKVIVLAARKTGRALDQADAVHKLLSTFKSLKAHARLRFKIAVTQPPIDTSNPSSLGITTTLGLGETSFVGAPPGRIDDITAVATRLNKILIQPNQDVSFNTLVGLDWVNRVYQEQERQVRGQLVPARGGAMQQVATTFFRALFASGLPLEERHAHVHRFAWYEPPTGLDAVVSPSNNQDLRFRNDTGKYLFLKVRVEPIRKELWIYLYGPTLKRKVAVDRQGKIIKQYPHGNDVARQDPTLSPGNIRQIAWAHDGADTVVERTIDYGNGDVKTDRVQSHYQPWRAILLTGAAAKSTATPTAKAKHPVTPTPTSNPGPTATPTFNH